MFRKTPILTGRELFRAAAPRLERAHRERREARLLVARERVQALDRVYRATWRVEHRELSILRSSDRSFVKAKQEKLDAAREQLARAQRALEKTEERWKAA